MGKFGFGSFGGFAAGGGGFRAVPMFGPESVLHLATMVLEAAEKDHNLAVEIATTVRDATISMVVAMALVSQMQDPEKPIITLSMEMDSEHKHTPDEFLASLQHNYEGTVSMEAWEDLVAKFRAVYSNEKADRIIDEIPDDFGVSDILGEKE